ncbi:uncharacterized protein RBU57_012923 isoform 1-T1 [Macrochelys suwanniensis]
MYVCALVLRAPEAWSGLASSKVSAVQAFTEFPSAPGLIQAEIPPSPSSSGITIFSLGLLSKSPFISTWNKPPLVRVLALDIGGGLVEGRDRALCIILPPARWSLPNPEYYTLRYADGPQLYITEQTRCDIKNGTILQLAVSPSRAARQLMERTQSHSMEARLDAMKELAKLSADVTFATEFINMEGITVLTRLVESGTKLLSQ